jgi:hypothetical protein
MFLKDKWLHSHLGQVIFTREAFSLTGSIMFIATQCIAHTLAIFSANMNVERSKLFLIQMKPEFCFPLHCQTSVAKHYFASISMKEGNAYRENEAEIKGVHLKSSAAPIALVKDSQSKMKDIMAKIQAGKKISIVEELQRVAGIERKIKESLLNGAVEFYKQSKIKSPEAYALGPEQSPYLHHMLWENVFSPKYGPVEAPIYSVIKIPSILDNPTAMKKWISSIADEQFKERLIPWLAKYKKTVLPTFYLSSQYVKSNGIPTEIKSIIDVKKITLDLTRTDRMVLETLGYFAKTDWLISEMGY